MSLKLFNDLVTPLFVALMLAEVSQLGWIVGTIAGVAIALLMVASHAYEARRARRQGGSP
jgi:hypothetical protein